jgi:UDP-N-acetylglucosamine 2-epimerase (non-hydrolysing)
VKVLSVVGARPQFVKVAPVASAFSTAEHEHLIVHTGQHYDAKMSDVFFEQLDIPAPAVHLGVGSGSHGAQTAAMLTGLEEVFLAQRPDWVVVYGDTNSTLAAAVGAVKLHIPVAHVEAGLRSFNRAMPEEHNRILTDHAADLLLAPTDEAVAHLEREGLKDRTVLVGDVMVDILLRVRDAVRAKPVPLPVEVPEGPYLVATVHRAENTDEPARLTAVLAALEALPQEVLLLAHPRLVSRAEAAGLPLVRPGLTAVPPVGYPELVQLTVGSAGVVTDSGGLQKEAYLLEVPCTTLRHETEWPETLVGDWNVLAGDLAGLGDVVGRSVAPRQQGTPFGSGQAADAVVRAVVAHTP